MANIDSVKLPNGNEYNLQDVVTPRDFTNLNLLINPWFTVNQRGWTSGQSTDGAYCVDRWFMSYGAPSPGTVAVTSNGIKLTPMGAYVLIGQRIEESILNFLVGKTLTLSVLLSDGTIKSGTVSNFSITGTTFYVDAQLKLDFVHIANVWSSFNIFAYSEVTVRAMKLEIGSESTLHLDTAPDYTTELLKCQRYYKQYTASEGNAYFLTVTVQTSANVYGLLNIGDMRTVPSVSYRGTFEVYVNNANYSVTYAGAVQRVNGYILLMFEGTGLPTGTSGELKIKSAGDYIAFSSEL